MNQLTSSASTSRPSVSADFTVQKSPQRVKQNPTFLKDTHTFLEMSAYRLDTELIACLYWKLLQQESLLSPLLAQQALHHAYIRRTSYQNAASPYDGTRGLWPPHRKHMISSGYAEDHRLAQPMMLRSTSTADSVDYCLRSAREFSTDTHYKDPVLFCLGAFSCIGFNPVRDVKVHLAARNSHSRWMYHRY